MNNNPQSARVLPIAMLAVMATLAGCATSGRSSTPGPLVRSVRCLYDQRPWLDLDAEGDRDPEGIRFRVFLDDGKDRGKLYDGTIEVRMYRFDRQADGSLDRRLADTWTYPTSDIHTIKSGILGKGYMLNLRWSDKDTAGKDIEVVTLYQDPFGRVTRSVAKRFRVPKYTKKSTPS